MPIKLAIVEDKPPILRNIKQKLMAYDDTFQLVGEAMNGQAAIPMLLAVRPDIVFTDIRMPVMDGLTLIEAVKDQLPSTHFVILTGYDEFEYAKRAIRLEVYEYLLKPVTLGELNRVLASLVPHILAHKQQAAQRYLEQLIRGGAPVTDSTLCNFNSACYKLLLVCLGPYPLYNVSGYSPQSWCVEDIWAHLLPSSEGQIWCVSTADSNIFAVMVGDEPCMGSPTAHHLLVSFAAEQPAEYSFINIAEGGSYASVRDCAGEYSPLLLLLRQRSLFGRSSLVRLNFSSSFRAEAAPEDHVFCQKLAAAYKAGQRKTFFAKLEAGLFTWQEQNATQHCIQNSLNLLVKTLQEIVPAASQVDYRLEIDELLSLACDYSALRTGLFTMFDIFWKELSGSAPSASLEDAIQKVEQHLLAHYTESVSVNQLAGAMGYAPAYFSRQYKKRKGLSPMEHLTRIRVSRACELLCTCPQLKLKQISEMVGYSNPLYFSRIFKAFTGVSPSVYKERG